MLLHLCLCSVLLFTVCLLFGEYTVNAVIGKSATPHELMVYGEAWPDYVHRLQLSPETLGNMETRLYRIRYKEEIAGSTQGNIRKADRMVGSLMTELDMPMTDVERIDRIICWICSHLTYDKDYHLRGLADALSDGKGVCWHYSYLFKTLCDDIGIKCRVIEGEARNERHAWNEITYNGEAYYFDLTWADYEDPFYPSDCKYAWLDLESFNAVQN